MQAVKINERIKVRADFSPGGRVTPVLFRRGERDAFRIRAVNAAWEDREGQGKLLYFSVRVAESEDIFQLRYRESDRTWWMDSVLMDG